MVKKSKITFIALLAVSALAFLFAAFATMGSATVKADAANILPDGYYAGEYTVMDLAQTYGTEGKISITTTSETNYAYEMKENRAVRLNIASSSSPWGIRFGMFNGQKNADDTSISYMFGANKAYAYFEVRKDTTKAVALRIMYNSANLTGSYDGIHDFTRPSWIDFASAHEYNVEVGAPEIFDADGTYMGVLFYLEFDGVRIAEQFVSKDQISHRFQGGYFVVNTQKPTDITVSDLGAIDLTDKATVTFDADSYNYKGTAVTPKPAVTAVLEKEGISYGQVIDQQYYDVTYQNNDKEGTATATVTFKGKYTGTASGQFVLKVSVDASKAVITLSKILYSEDANGKERTPTVVSVDLDGKAITAYHYDVAYVDNVKTGTAKVVLTFKNGYYGTAECLFRIDPVLSDKHWIDDNPTVMDLAETYGGESGKIEITDSVNADLGASKLFALDGADVVKFKMTTNANTWNQYFSIFCSTNYFVSAGGAASFSIPKNTAREANFKLFKKSNAAIAAKAMELPDGWDITQEKTFKVEVGALKIFYTDDGETSYAGRFFYMEIDGERLVEYVYVDSALSFDGNFFVGGNTDKIVIEKFESMQTESEPTGTPENSTVGAPDNNTFVSGGITNDADFIAKDGRNGYTVLVAAGLIAVAVCAFAVCKLKKSKK